MKAHIVYQPLKTTEVTNAPATIDIDEPIRLYRGEFTTVSGTPGIVGNRITPLPLINRDYSP